jgi:hypothetical protein
MLVVLLWAAAWPTPPFSARLAVDTANVRARPEASAPAIGLLRADDEVQVTDCTPSCASEGAWALLEGDGAVRLSLLRASRVDDPTVPPAAIRYRYGRVREGGAAVHAARDPRSPVVERRRAGQDLAFRPDDTLAARGWLLRPFGGFIQAERIRLATPSPFQGQHDPSLPLAFAIRDLPPQMRRHERWPVQRIAGGTVELPVGRVPRTSVRIAWTRARPAAVGADAYWVDIDLGEQTLVAYEGDRPVFATLISTGRADRPTPPGLTRVYAKEVHAPMHGDRPDPYFVDEVPFVQYFRAGMALHGTFWHDRFGRRTSHGCVNLSMTDATFLFDWAPPRLPAGWHAIYPAATQLPSLWVLVEHRRRASFPPMVEPPARDPGRLSSAAPAGGRRAARARDPR